MAACVAAVVALTGATARASAGPVAVQRGTTFRTRIFPDDAFTVADARMATGRRVNLRQGVDYAACDSANSSICDGFRLLNQLDGFDLQPRVTIPFTGPIDVSSVNADDVFVQGPGGRTPLTQLVWDPDTNTLAGLTSAQLYEGSPYVVVVTNGVKAASGDPIDACGGPACVASFTTRTASGELEKIRRAMDDGSAYAAAHLTDRKLSFVQNGTPDVFPAQSVQPSLADPLNGMTRLDQTTTDPNKLDAGAIPNLVPPPEAGSFAFGSFLSPRYQFTSADPDHDAANGDTEAYLPEVPTTQTPQPFGADRLGVVMITPPGAPPPGGWPVAIYGPGFTRSKFDIFVSADHNAAAGIATIATDPAGHAFGPNSKVQVHAAGTTTTFLGYGRGRDLDGDGFIGDGLNDGVGPTDHKTVDKPADKTQKVTADAPSTKALDGLRSGLMQTVVDDMALARAIKAGVDVPSVGTDVLSHDNISYYGISFGGIYGTMLMGTDPVFIRGLLNVPGGPIADIARLSGFRGDLHDKIASGRPNELNGGPSSSAANVVLERAHRAFVLVAGGEEALVHAVVGERPLDRVPHDHDELGVRQVLVQQLGGDVVERAGRRLTGDVGPAGVALDRDRRLAPAPGRVGRLPRQRDRPGVASGREEREVLVEVGGDVFGVVEPEEVGLLLGARQHVRMVDEVAIQRRRPALVGPDDEERRPQTGGRY